jgi:MFS family permease
MTETITTPAAEPITTAPAGRPARRLNSGPFALLFTAQSTSMAAEFFSYIALSWLTLQVTGSGFALGAVLATQAIPRALLMLVGGAVTDRFTPIKVMTATAAVRAALVAAVAILVIAGRVQAWELFLVAAALGVLGAFFLPASNSAIPSVVDEDLLETANAWIMVASTVSTIAGPALAGLVVARWGSGPAFAVDAAGYALAAVACLPVIGLRAGAAGGAPSRNLVAAIREGFTYMWSNPMLRALLAVIVVLNFAAAGPFEVGVTLLAKVRWGGPLALGVAFGAIGLGALLGAVASGALKGRIPLGWAIVAIGFIFGLGFPLIGLAPSVWPAAVVAAILGMFNGLLKVLGFSWIQRRTPPEFLGRVMSLVMAAAFGVSPLSFAIAGALVGLNTEVLFVAGGAACILVGIGCAASRTVRETK